MIRTHGVILGILAPLLVPSDLASQRKVGAIGGRVVDGAGQPVAGAKVALRWRAHPELPSLIGYTLGDAGLLERQFTSGKNGRFRIRPPHRGPFLLVALHGETSSTQVFPVLPGDYHELRLEPNHYMGGQVLDAKGQPVPGASMRLVPTDELQRIRLGLYNQPERRPVATTDEGGRFRLHFEHGYLRDPRWNVLMALQAEKDGVMTATLDHLRPTSASKKVVLRLAGKRGFRATIVDRATGRPIPRVRVLDPLNPGHVVLTNAKGSAEVPPQRGEKVMLIAKGYTPAAVALGAKTATKVNRSMAPGVKLTTRLSGPKGALAGARILLASPQGNAYPIEWQDVVGADGKVTLDSLPRDTMTILFVEVEGRFVKFLEGKFTQDTTLPPIRVNPDRLVRGRVLAANKMPIAGARVALQTMLNPSNPRRVTYTDRAGRFEFDGVYPAKHEVIAARGEHGQGVVSIAATDLDQPVTITLAPKHTIEGLVLQPDGKPAPGAWVTIYGSRSGSVMRGPRTTNTCLGTMTDEKGRFRFGVGPRTQWSIVAAMLFKGAHCNQSSSATADQKNLTLKVAVQNN